MEKNQPLLKVSQWSMQDYLSIGYIYLLLLGIVSDSIYYSLLGISILEYSNILDVLLSPLIYLTKGAAFPIVIFLIPILTFVAFSFMRKAHLKKREQPAYQQKHDIEKLDRFYSLTSRTRTVLTYSAIAIFSAYFGYGLGGGNKMKERLEEGNLRVDHHLIFNGGDTLLVHLIGHNSQYVFYVEEDEKTVSVSPIEGNVKRIEKFEREEN